VELNLQFMLDNCKKSCGTCHYTQADIDKVVATPCEDLDEGCPGADDPFLCALTIDANPIMSRKA
jgi:hypothetical protein